MKKKLLATLLSVAMVSTVLAGCGGSTDSASTDGAAAETTEEAPADEAADDGAAEEGTEEAAAEEEIPTSTFGDPNGTHMEMWTFVELHGQHYGNMVDKWNEQNPDRTIEIMEICIPNC